MSSFFCTSEEEGRGGRAEGSGEVEERGRGVEVIATSDIGAPGGPPNTPASRGSNMSHA